MDIAYRIISDEHGWREEILSLESVEIQIDGPVVLKLHIYAFDRDGGELYDREFDKDTLDSWELNIKSLADKI